MIDPDFQRGVHVKPHPCSALPACGGMPFIPSLGWAPLFLRFLPAESHRPVEHLCSGPVAKSLMDLGLESLQFERRRHINAGIWSMSMVARTGLATFNVRMISLFRELGMAGQAEGGVTKDGVVLDCPAKERVFELLEWGWVEPGERR